MEHPTHGCLRIAQGLALRGVQVSSTGVRGVWSRHDLLTKHERLLPLEESVRKRKVKLTDAQIRLLERVSPEFREQHFETHHTGDLVAVDTFYCGTLKGVGKVYLQSVLDCHSRYAWARLHTSKMPLTAVHILNNDVLPFFGQYELSIETILSDNCREYCGRSVQHPYGLILQLEDIEHRRAQVRRPRSNGFIELHRTLLDEHPRIKGREKWYESVEEMQKDLDEYLVLYNTERPHQGRNMKGRTPSQAFEDGRPKPKNGRQGEGRRRRPPVPTQPAHSSHRKSAPERGTSAREFSRLTTRMGTATPASPE